MPNGWQPGGIDTDKDNAFYAGSRATGAVYEGNLKTRSGDALVGPWGGAAVGMRVDRRNRLFVAGGGTGTASVYDARSGELLKRYTLTAAPTFVNDVVVTERAAYFTDSLKRQLYVLDLGRRGALPEAARTLPLTGELLSAPTGGFELNGIEAAGRRLIAVHSALGRLYEIDPRDGGTDEIELEGGDVANGDGILLHGRRRTRGTTWSGCAVGSRHHEAHERPTTARGADLHGLPHRSAGSAWPGRGRGLHPAQRRRTVER